MVPRVKRYFWYGVALASLLWGFILVMYLHIQDDASLGSSNELGRKHQRLKPRHDFAKRFPGARTFPPEPWQPGAHGNSSQTDLSQLGVIRTPEDQQKRDKGYKLYAFNELISDRLGFHRAIPDVRHTLCEGQEYLHRLPVASIIICFYNEAWSTLLRTVHSVLDRSPPHLIHKQYSFSTGTLVHILSPD